MANPQNIERYKFEKGESGNPNGRPKGVPNTKTRLQRLLNLTQQLENPITGVVEGFTIAEQLDLQQILKAKKGDTVAYKEIVDRLEGKAQQSTDITTNGKDLIVPIYGGLSGRPKDVSIQRHDSDTQDIPTYPAD